MLVKVPFSRLIQFVENIHQTDATGNVNSILNSIEKTLSKSVFFWYNVVGQKGRGFGEYYTDHCKTRRITMKLYQSNMAVKLVSILSLFIIVSLTGCGGDNNGKVGCTDYSAKEPFEYQVTVENQNSFEIHGINGSIDITGTTDSALVKIWGEKIVKAESVAEAEAHLADLEVKVENDQNEVTVRTDQPKGSDCLNYEVVYHVRIPELLKVKIENVNGKVEVDSVKSDVEISLTNGNIHLTDILGNIDVNLTNGDIFGDVTLPLPGVCEMTIVNGKIDLSIPKSTSAEFSASVTNGDVNVSNLVLNNSNTTKNSTTGTLADGDGTITLRVVNGQISVKGF